MLFFSSEMIKANDGARMHHDEMDDGPSRNSISAARPRAMMVVVVVVVVQQGIWETPHVTVIGCDVM